MKKKIKLEYLIITVFVLILSVAMFRNSLDPFDDENFDKTKWMVLTKSLKNIERGKMARDLISNYVKNGLPKSEVINLLGEPDFVLTGSRDSGGNELFGKETFGYSVGYSRYWDFDDAYVYIHLDDSGVVLGCQINGY